MPQAAGNRLIVILNDNDMSIAPPVGGAVATISRGWSRRANISSPATLAQKLRAQDARAAPPTAARKAEEYARGWLTGGTLVRGTGLLLCRPGRRP